jgi:hypothetical protein
MLLFLPPIVQALVGAGVLVTGVATHIVILDMIGCLGIAVGGYRWLRQRGGAAR